MKHAIAVVAVVGLLAAVPVTPALAQTDDTQPSLTAELREDGSATVTVQLTYDLESDSEQAAFQNLQDNESMRNAVVSRFRDRMSRVADAMAEDTGRDVSVSDPAIDLSTADSGSTGVVVLSIDWDGFAAQTEDGLTVTDPFATNYDPDRRVIVVGPDGYELTTAQPSPTSTDGRTVEWSADADLDGFEVTYTDTDADGASTTEADGADTAGDTTSGDGPGFGLLAALLALLTAGALARRRQQ